MPEQMKWSERFGTESYNRIGQDVTLGVVDIDPEKCRGCGLCAAACAAAALELHEKKSRLIAHLPLCYSCGDCVALCPDEAIQLKVHLSLHRRFRYLDRGAAFSPRRF